MSNLPTAGAGQFSLAPQSLDQALVFADYLSKSDIVPKDFQGKPGNVLVAIQWGMELGLQPLQAMQNIAVINGRPSLWGDAVIGLVKASPLCEYVVEEVTDTMATCRVKRKGEPEQVRTFSMEDARKASLSGKAGPWSQYPKRMMQMRARAWALRDVFPDVLRGMPIAEEVRDMEKDITPPKTAAEFGAAALPAGDNSEQTQFLIGELEKLAATGDAGQVQDLWKSYTTEEKQAVGAAEWERIKNLTRANKPAKTIDHPAPEAGGDE